MGMILSIILIEAGAPGAILITVDFTTDPITDGVVDGTVAEM